MEAHSHPRQTVLVVDDDPISGGLLVQVLRMGGFEAVRTACASHGLLTLCKARAGVDWLITKLEMPGLIDAWILADEFHRHQADRPVVLLTDSPTGCDAPAIDAVAAPAGSPLLVVEALQALAQPRRPAPSLETSRAA